MERTRKPGDLQQAQALPMSAADTPSRTCEVVEQSSRTARTVK